MSANVTGQTEIMGIYGCPVGHTLSPRMHNAAFQALNMDMIYLPFEVKRDSLKEAMEAIKALGFRGVNLTQPHKMAVLRHLDVLTDEAKKIGAVNTVVNDHGMLVGHNTDGTGFMRSIREDYGFDPKNKNVVVFGAGGAARAICSVLGQGAAKRLMIVNRTIKKADILAQKVGGHTMPWNDPKLQEEIAKADLMVNATSTCLDFDHRWLQENVFVYDIAYGHRGSLFIHAVQQRGGRIGDGLSMLLYQGALAFELWTGRKAPLEVMRKALQQRDTK
jgi:shikimate dehydrogenase